MVIRPTRRQPGKKMFLKKKSRQYLESNDNEWQKYIQGCLRSPIDGFKGVYLRFCVESRLDAVLSKDPQLGEDYVQNLPLGLTD